MLTQVTGHDRGEISLDLLWRCFVAFWSVVPQRLWQGLLGFAYGPARGE